VAGEGSAGARVALIDARRAHAAIGRRVDRARRVMLNPDVVRCFGTASTARTATHTRITMRLQHLFAATLWCLGAAAAQTGAPPASPIGFDSVAAAQKALEARDGDGTVVTHADGWTVINEPLAAAQWSFTPAGYYAHPAVVRRTIQRSPDGAVSVETTSLCEAPEAACSKLLAEFAAMNDRISQAAGARGRRGSAPAAR
jgi:hypothetical protein